MQLLSRGILCILESVNGDYMPICILGMSNKNNNNLTRGCMVLKISTAVCVKVFKIVCVEMCVHIYMLRCVYVHVSIYVRTRCTQSTCVLLNKCTL